MKYKVIGWTFYDNEEFESVYCSEAGMEAIIDDIREHGYEFSGENHQGSDCGAPVLNDGKMRHFTQRAFGRLMARAHGDYSYYGYCSYDFAYWSLDERKMAEDDDRDLYFKSDIEGLVEENLCEELVFNATKDQMKMATNTGKLVFSHRDSLRYLDVGDTLLLKCDDEKRRFLVEEYKRDEHYYNIQDPKGVPEITVTVILKEIL